MTDRNSEAIEGLIEIIKGRGIDHHYGHSPAIYTPWADAKTVTAGIEAIREMQAELAGREESDRKFEQMFEEVEPIPLGEGEIERIVKFVESQEVLRKEGKRIIAQRDELRDKLRATEKVLDVSEGKVERLEEERGAMISRVSELLGSWNGIECAHGQD